MFYRAVRAGNYSTIGYCQLKNNEVISRKTGPLMVPEFDYEKQGMEDPRIIYLEGQYYLFYIAFDGRNASIAYAVSSDLVTFRKKGVISPTLLYDEAVEIFRQSGLKQAYVECKSYCEAVGGKGIALWDKDAFLFPRKIKNKFALVHRILPDIQIAYFADFSELTADYWREYLYNLRHYIVLEPKYPYESRNIGGGCPPIETEDGWLIIYHGVADTADGVVYHASAALLDREDPTEVLGRLQEPLFFPQEPWETKGDVNNVVFPSGAVVKNGRLYIYYGAADRVIGLKSVDLFQLLQELKQ